MADGQTRRPASAAPEAGESADRQPRHDAAEGPLRAEGARADTGEVRVAVVGPFSGPRAAWGDLLTRAAREHRVPGVSWAFHDDEGDSERGAHVARTLVAEGGHRAVIGHFNSVGAEGALPVYRAAGLPLLLPLATSPGLLRGGGPGALRWCPHDLGQLEALRRAARELGHEGLQAVDDGSRYGRLLVDRFRSLPPTGAEAGAPPAGDAGLRKVPPDEGPAAVTTPEGHAPEGALLVCGTHHGAADTARRLRAEGFDGRLFFTDDCAVDEFAVLLGADAARGSMVGRLRGGPYGLVDAAFGALVAALCADPAATGGRLLEAVRRHAGLVFGADGDPVDAAAGDGWEVVPVHAVAPPPAAAPDPPAAAQRQSTSAGLPSGFDVAVIGAGVVGAASAAALAGSGLSVCLVASGPEAPSATRWSGALVRAYDPDPGARDLAVLSHQLLWGADPPAAVGFRRTGSLCLLGPDGLGEAERGVDRLRAAGVRAELLSPDVLRDRWPSLTAPSEDGVAGAVWEPDGGYADPSGTAAVYRTRAVRHGAVALTPATVRTLEQHRRGVRVVTDRTSVTARCAVVAAGAGAAALLGDRLPLRPGGPAPRTRRIRYGFFQRSGRDLPALVDQTTGMWARPHLDGAAADGFLVGRPVDEWGAAPDGGDTLTEEQIAYIRRGGVRRWPWLAHAPYLGGRFGADLYHPDGPFLGVVPGEPPTVVAGCWSGSGFKTAPGAAEQVADAVRLLLEERTTGGTASSETPARTAR